MGYDIKNFLNIFMNLKSMVLKVEDNTYFSKES
jgi:hypothetical protein